MMSDLRVFGPQIEAVSRQCPVMVAPLIGTRIEDMASLILDTAPRRFALAGMDLGGMVAMEVLRRAPDRVTRLALIGTTPLPESPQHAAAREPLIIKAKAGRLGDVMTELLPPESYAPGTARRAAQDLVQAMAMELGCDVFANQTRALQKRRDQQATLRKIKQPTMVMCGEHEQIYSVKRHQFMADLIPYASLTMIPDAGHFPSLENPDATTAALQAWLAQPLVLR